MWIYRFKGQYIARARRVFDMDSTLIQTEVIDELAELGTGVGEQVKSNYRAAMEWRN
jgi:phosphoserine phosphatase